MRRKGNIGRQEQIVDVPFPFAQEEFAKAEVPELRSAEQVIIDTSQERVSQRTVNILRSIGSKSPEDQKEGGKIAMTNTFLQVIRKEVGGRLRAMSTPWCWKAVSVNDQGIPEQVVAGPVLLDIFQNQ